MEDRVGAPETSNRTLVVATVVFGFLALLSSGFGIQMKSPPTFLPVWTLTWSLSFMAILAALPAAQGTRNMWSRFWISAGTVLALLGAGVAMYAYYGNYHDYPWLVVFFLAAVMIPGGVGFGMRVVPIGLAAFLVYGFYSSRLAHGKKLPVVQQAGDIECRVVSLQGSERSICEFELRSRSGSDLSRVLDMKHVRVDGQAGPLVPIAAWRARAMNPEGGFYDDPKGPAIKFHAWMFPPSWLRCCDLTVTVPQWPANPVVSVTVPLHTTLLKLAEAASGSFRLAVSHVGWGYTQSDPPDKCVFMDVDHSGLNQEIRIVDDLGNVVQFHDVGRMNLAESIEAWPINPRAKSLTVQLYDPAERRRAETVFTFRSVENLPKVRN